MRWLFVAVFLKTVPACFAGDGSASIALQASAPPICILKPAQTLFAQNMSLASTSASRNAVIIDRLMDPATLQILPALISVRMEGLCNHANTISLQSVNGGLRGSLGDAPSSSFINHVDYRAHLGWGSAVVDLRTEQSGSTQSPPALIGGAQHGDLRLDLTLENANASGSLVADTYTDTLIITLGARF